MHELEVLLSRLKMEQFNENARNHGDTEKQPSVPEEAKKAQETLPEKSAVQSAMQGHASLRLLSEYQGSDQLY